MSGAVLQETCGLTTAFWGHLIIDSCTNASV